MRAGMEWRIAAGRVPDHIVEPLGAVPGNRLVDPALLVARCKPRRDNSPNSGAGKMQNLQAGASRQPFRQERSENFSGPLVRTDQRRHPENEAF